MFLNTTAGSAGPAFRGGSLPPTGEPDFKKVRDFAAAAARVQRLVDPFWQQETTTAAGGSVQEVGARLDMQRQERTAGRL